MEDTCSILLAAGDGKRMKSTRPKVLCKVLQKPMISWVTDSILQAGIPQCCVVVGAGAREVEAALPRGFVTARQQERLGTGHAAMMAADFLRDTKSRQALVCCGDAPFLSAKDIQAAYAQHKEQHNRVTLVSARLDNPTGYGRVVRRDGRVVRIVEQSDADEATLAIGEINAGAYWFEASFLLEFFSQMRRDNGQGEYYLTDAVGYAASRAYPVNAYIAHPYAAMGANDRRALQGLNRIARDAVLDRLLEEGVDIPLDDGILVGPDVRVGPDTTLLPGTLLVGRTTVGSGCVIGPNSHIEDAIVGDNCKIISSHVAESTIGKGVKIGPMSNIRPGCDIGPGVKIGDFVEVKNSVIGPETAVAHLTYVGDSDVGARCNFGCGVVTVNYDGDKKYRTTIGDGVFLGCNTNLIAPVEMGDHSYSAAGTTVMKSVPEDALVVGRPETRVIPGWSVRKNKYKKGRQAAAADDKAKE